MEIAGGQEEEDKSPRSAEYFGCKAVGRHGASSSIVPMYVHRMNIPRAGS
jgi:hypothetical protein